MPDQEKYYICHSYRLEGSLPCQLVHLSIEKYRYWGERSYYGWTSTIPRYEIILRSNKYPNLYEVLNYYRSGYSLIPRKERYRNIYMALEQISEDIELPFRAVRHSLSHSRKKLTNPKTKNYLMDNFGDVIINLDIYAHNKHFQRVLRQIGEKVESILVERLLCIIPKHQNYLERYYVP